MSHNVKEEMGEGEKQRGNRQKAKESEGCRKGLSHKGTQTDSKASFLRK